MKLQSPRTRCSRRRVTCSNDGKALTSLLFLPTRGYHLLSRSSCRVSWTLMTKERKKPWISFMAKLQMSKMQLVTAILPNEWLLTEIETKRQALLRPAIKTPPGPPSATIGTLQKVRRQLRQQGERSANLKSPQSSFWRSRRSKMLLPSCMRQTLLQQKNVRENHSLLSRSWQRHLQSEKKGCCWGLLSASGLLLARPRAVAGVRASGRPLAI